LKPTDFIASPPGIQEVDQPWIETDPVMDKALEALRSSRFEVSDHDPEFVGAVVRRAKVETRQRSLSYWIPVLISGIAAFLALFAVIQALLAGSEQAAHEESTLPPHSR
jgi:hypothetical protein